MRYPTRGIFRGVVPFCPTPLLSAVLGRIRTTSRPVRLQAPRGPDSHDTAPWWSCQWRTQYISRSRPALLLTSAWPGQPWHSSLAELSVAHAVRLQLEQYLLLQGIFLSPIVQMFKRHAWMLFGTGLEDRDSLRMLPASWLSRTSFNESCLRQKRYVFCTWHTGRQAFPISIPLGDLGLSFHFYSKTSF